MLSSFYLVILLQGSFWYFFKIALYFNEVCASPIHSCLKVVDRFVAILAFNNTSPTFLNIFRFHLFNFSTYSTFISAIQFMRNATSGSFWEALNIQINSLHSNKSNSIIFDPWLWYYRQISLFAFHAQCSFVFGNYLLDLWFITKHCLKKSTKGSIAFLRLLLFIAGMRLCISYILLF